MSCGWWARSPSAAAKPTFNRLSTTLSAAMPPSRPPSEWPAFLLTSLMRIAMLPSLLAPVAAGQCFGGAEMAALDLPTEALAALGDELLLIG